MSLSKPSADRIALLKKNMSIPGKKAFVLGSAPGSVPLSSAYDDWQVMTVNASQTILTDWGLRITPYITIFNTMLVAKKRTSSSAARSVLSGQATKNLLVVSDTDADLWMKLRLFLMRYKYGSLTALTTDDRLMIISTVLDHDPDTMPKPSNGIFLALLAFYLGASKVVMGGFSFSKTGHAYNALNLRRSHVNEDMKVLEMVLAKGLPIYTNDAVFSKESGVPFLN